MFTHTTRNQRVEAQRFDLNHLPLPPGVSVHSAGRDATSYRFHGDNGVERIYPGDWIVTRRNSAGRVIATELVRAADFDALYTPIVIEQRAYLVGALDMTNPEAPVYKGCGIFSEQSPSTTMRIRWFPIHETSGKDFQEAVDRMHVEIAENPYFQVWAATLDAHKR